MTAKLTAKLIKTDGSIREVSPRNGRNFQLFELVTMLECDHIEVVRPESLSNAALVVDEEGKLEGKSLNVIATRVWLQHNGHWDPIAGNALLCTWDQLCEEGEEGP